MLWVMDYCSSCKVLSPLFLIRLSNSEKSITKFQYHGNIFQDKIIKEWKMRKTRKKRLNQKWSSFLIFFLISLKLDYGKKDSMKHPWKYPQLIPGLGQLRRGIFCIELGGMCGGDRTRSTGPRCPTSGAACRAETNHIKIYFQFCIWENAEKCSYFCWFSINIFRSTYLKL